MKISYLAISMLITVLAENRSKKEMLETKCVFFFRPKFRIQSVKYVVYQTQASM